MEASLRPFRAMGSLVAESEMTISLLLEWAELDIFGIRLSPLAKYRLLSEICASNQLPTRQLNNIKSHENFQVLPYLQSNSMISTPPLPHPD